MRRGSFNQQLPLVIISLHVANSSFERDKLKGHRPVIGVPFFREKKTTNADNSGHLELTNCVD